MTRGIARRVALLCFAHVTLGSHVTPCAYSPTFSDSQPVAYTQYETHPLLGTTGVPFCTIEGMNCYYGTSELYGYAYGSDTHTWTAPGQSYPCCPRAPSDETARVALGQQYPNDGWLVSSMSSWTEEELIERCIDNCYQTVGCDMAITCTAADCGKPMCWQRRGPITASTCGYDNK